MVRMRKPPPYSVVKPGNVSPVRRVPSDILKPDYALTGRIAHARKSIEIKPDWHVERMRQACAVARRILNKAASYVQPGVSTDEIDRRIHEDIIDVGAYPSTLSYRGYPKSLCTSVNNVACHGIPDDRPLENGDIVSVDVTVYLNNFHGDCSETFLVGKVDSEGQKLVDIARKCRDEAIKICKPGENFSSIGKIISATANREGFRVMPAFCGHGIGTYFHGPPDILHCDNDFTGKMREGMTFTIEPVISEGIDEVVVLEDGWTAVSTDNSRSAQFEHTLLITSNGVDVLTEDAK